MTSGKTSPSRRKRDRASPSTLQLRLVLSDIEPPIWRRVLVPRTITLATLDLVLRAAMGWRGAHLHEFLFGAQSYGIPYPDDPALAPDHEQRITLAQALGSRKRFLYRYDFGDGWEHRIFVEASAQALAPPAIAVCVDGAHACPPDDVGGPEGYAHFLEAMLNPDHPDHQTLTQWHGGPFDPARMDLHGINHALAQIRPGK